MKRLKVLLDKTEAEIAFNEKKLKNPKFVNNAPVHIVDQQKEKLKEHLASKKAILANLKVLEANNN